MKAKKGIIVAGGRATRLHPATLVFGKQFLPVFDKPMIYYPLTTLIEAGIREILMVVSPRDNALFQALLGDGSAYGVSISYVEQPVAKGIADAFALGEEFIGDDPVCLILGDNFFYGPGFQDLLKQAQSVEKGATVFCVHVDNPRAYGVARCDDAGNVLELAEKPQNPTSNWAVTGLYFYDADAVKLAKTLTPSARGEMEITDLNIKYLERKELNAIRFAKDFKWYDMGTNDTLLESSLMVRAEEQKIGRKIGCPFEAAFRMGFIDKAQMAKSAARIENKPYADYLLKLAGT